MATRQTAINLVDSDSDTESESHDETEDEYHCSGKCGPVCCSGGNKRSVTNRVIDARARTVQLERDLHAADDADGEVRAAAMRTTATYRALLQVRIAQTQAVEACAAQVRATQECCAHAVQHGYAYQPQAPVVQQAQSAMQWSPETTATQTSAAATNCAKRKKKETVMTNVHVQHLMASYRRCFAEYYRQRGYTGQLFPFFVCQQVQRLCALCSHILLRLYTHWLALTVCLPLFIQVLVDFQKTFPGMHLDSYTLKSYLCQELQMERLRPLPIPPRATRPPAITTIAAAIARSYPDTAATTAIPPAHTLGRQGSIIAETRPSSHAPNADTLTVRSPLAPAAQVPVSASEFTPPLVSIAAVPTLTVQAQATAVVNQPTPTLARDGEENALLPRDNSVLVENTKIMNRRVGETPATTSAINEYLSNTTALMQRAASYILDSECEASLRSSVGESNATSEQGESVLSPASPADTPALQSDLPVKIVSISPVGTGDKSSFSLALQTQTQTQQRSRKRRREREEDLMELQDELEVQELEKQQLVLENLKLALELGLVTQAQCTEKGRRVVQMCCQLFESKGEVSCHPSLEFS